MRADPSLPDRAQEIRARCEKATPGPWRSDPMYDGGSTLAIMRDWRRYGGPSAAVQGPNNWIHESDERQPDDNAEFIAHARSDIPWLLDHLLAAQEVNSKIVAACRYWSMKKLSLDSARPDFTRDQLRELEAAEGRLLSAIAALQARASSGERTAP